MLPFVHLRTPSYVHPFIPSSQPLYISKFISYVQIAILSVYPAYLSSLQRPSSYFGSPPAMSELLTFFNFLPMAKHLLAPYHIQPAILSSQIATSELATSLLTYLCSLLRTPEPLAKYTSTVPARSQQSKEPTTVGQLIGVRGRRKEDGRQGTDHVRQGTNDGRQGAEL